MERYEIVIKDETQKEWNNISGEGQPMPSNVAGQDEQPVNYKEEKTSTMLKVVAKASINQARSLIVSRIGEFQRDTLLQQKIDDTINIVDTAMAFYVNPVYGAINLATSTASKLITRQIETEKEQNRLSVSLRRAGYINRSRE